MLSLVKTGLMFLQELALAREIDINGIVTVYVKRSKVDISRKKQDSGG